MSASETNKGSLAAAVEAAGKSGAHHPDDPILTDTAEGVQVQYPDGTTDAVTKEVEENQDSESFLEDAKGEEQAAQAWAAAENASHAAY